ncbi:MAG: GlcG/HbpS family heme-binding protein [Cyclobacteriaceae bacterium]
MTQFAKVSSREAFQLIEHTIFEAEKINKHLAVTICGPEGELISFLRMGGASPAALVIAQSKAHTAARDRKSTREMREFMVNANREQGFWGDAKITAFGGGLPIVQEGKVIGGIGVSGLSEAEDERIVCIAIEKVHR